MEKPGCILIMSSQNTRSRKAMVTRDRNDKPMAWPVEIRIAGVTIGLTVDAARDLTQQLLAVAA